MKETLQELFSFLKNPILEKDNNTNVGYRFQKFIHLLIISIITSTLLTPLFYIVETLGLVDLDNHAVEDLLNSFSKPMVFLFAVVLMPVLEELFFRGPLTLFHHGKTFKRAFYLFAIAFGFVHITNYEITTNVLLLAPILIAPHLFARGYTKLNTVLSRGRPNVRLLQ